MRVGVNVMPANFNNVFGFDPEDEDLAWLIGGKVGFRSFSLKIEYAQIGYFAAFRPIRDSDFGDTAGLDSTNIKGIKLGAEYKLSKAISVNGTFMDLKDLEGNDSEDAKLYQLDLAYKF